MTNRFFVFSNTLVLDFFLPLMFVIAWRYRTNFVRYYPYATIIEKSINKEREKEYDYLRNGNTARFDEY